MSGWPFAIECVLVPAAIGVTMFGIFEAWDRLRRRRGRDSRGLPIIDYSI